MLDWIHDEHPGPWRRALEPPLLGVVTFVTTLALADISYPAVTGWLHGDGAYLGWLDIYWLLEPGLLTTWLVALAVALAVGLAAAAGWSDRRFVRAVGGLLSLASLTAATLLIVQRPDVDVRLASGAYERHPAALPWPALLGLAAGCFGGAWLAIGKGLKVRQSWLRRGGVTVAITATALVLGAATLADVLDEYQHQTFRPVAGQLVAVMPLPPGTSASPGTRTITHEGRTYVAIDRPPLNFTHHDLRRVRRRTYRDPQGRHTGVSIRFASRLHDRIAQRSRFLSRHRYHDALYLDGKLYLVAPVQGILRDGRVFITDGLGKERPVSDRLYRALTR